MRHHKVLHEFLEDWVVPISNHLLKILYQLLEHLSQNLQLNFLYSGQYFYGYSFVYW
jgi:hypothetical protein